MSCSSYAGYSDKERDRLMRDGPCSCNHCTRQTVQAGTCLTELREKKQQREDRLKSLTETRLCIDNVVSEARVQLALKQLSTSKQRDVSVGLAKSHYEQALYAQQQILSELRLLETELSSIDADLEVMQETYRQAKDISALCQQDSQRLIEGA